MTALAREFRIRQKPPPSRDTTEAECSLLVNDEPFPFCIADEPIRIEVDPEGVCKVYVPVLALRVVLGDDEITDAQKTVELNDVREATA